MLQTYLNPLAELGGWDYHGLGPIAMASRDTGRGLLMTLRKRKIINNTY